MRTSGTRTFQASGPHVQRLYSRSMFGRLEGQQGGCVARAEWEMGRVVRSER